MLCCYKRVVDQNGKFMAKYQALSPSQVLVLEFLIVIFLGSVLLSLPQFSLGGVAQFTKYVLTVTLIAEGSGATILSLRWMGKYPIVKAICLGIFHAVSAFCNAGFGLFSDSLAGFRGDTAIFPDGYAFDHRWRTGVCCAQRPLLF
jgi:Trk-type K+ transport system membrane component